MNTNTKKVELEIGRIVEVRQCVGYVHILPDGAGLGLSGPNYKTGWLKANIADVHIENPQVGQPVKFEIHTDDSGSKQARNVTANGPKG